MKTIILIGMVSLGFLNQNHAASAEQTSFINQSDNEQFLELVSLKTRIKVVENTTEKNFYFDPTTVLPKAIKSLEQEIREDNLIIEGNIETQVTLSGLYSTSIQKIIQEDIQVTEAKDLDVYQPLDFEAINNNPNGVIELQNKCSLKQENIKL
ncbi:MAG TPA: hypothetical protein PK218_02220 [Flavobacterium sp.]|jgi:hypothetical protein|nr:hypothetical protein [Flavobacterium sp.]